MRTVSLWYMTNHRLMLCAQRRSLITGWRPKVPPCVNMDSDVFTVIKNAGFAGIFFLDFYVVGLIYLLRTVENKERGQS